MVPILIGCNALLELNPVADIKESKNDHEMREVTGNLSYNFKFQSSDNNKKIISESKGFYMKLQKRKSQNCN